MRYATLLLLCTLPAWIGPAPSGPEDESVFVKNLRPDQHESLLYVWTSDADAKQPDFLTVVDADPKSPGYGKILTTVPTGSTVDNEAHHFGYTVNADRIFAGGLVSNRLFIYDVKADPKHPALIKTIPDLGALSGYSGPHTYYAVPGGVMIAMLGSKDGTGPGALVRLDEQGNFVSALPAPNRPDDPGYMYDVGVKPELNRMVTSSWTHPHHFRGNPIAPENVGDAVAVHRQRGAAVRRLRSAAPQVPERGQVTGAEHDEAHARQPAAVREQFVALEPGRQGAVPRVAAERRHGRHDSGRQVRGGLRSIPDRPGPAARHVAEVAPGLLAPRFPRGVEQVRLVHEAAVARLPTQQPHGFAGIDVLVQRQRVGEIAHRAAGFPQGHGAQLALEARRAGRRGRQLEHGGARPVGHVEHLARRPALRRSYVGSRQIVDVHHRPAVVARPHHGGCFARRRRLEPSAGEPTAAAVHAPRPNHQSAHRFRLQHQLLVRRPPGDQFDRLEGIGLVHQPAAGIAVQPHATGVDQRFRLRSPTPGLDQGVDGGLVLRHGAGG